MMLVTTLEAGLVSAYGADGAAQVRTALTAYVQTAQPAQLAVLDDAVSMVGLGSVATGTDPASLTAGLQRVANAIGADSILIVGGDEIFPFWQVTNPVTDRSLDADAVVLTDNPYAQLQAAPTDDWLTPLLPSGRLCAGLGDSAQALCDILGLASANRSRRATRSGYVEFTDRAFEDSSNTVMLGMPGPGRLLITPDEVVSASNASELDARFLYCNLHGFLNDRAWQGWDSVRRVFLPALTPESMSASAVSGSVVFTEACYGLQTAGRAISGSCALSLLAAGAAAIVGSTNLSFGSFLSAPSNLIDADAMAKNFFSAAQTGAATLGRCLVAARSAFRSGSALSEYDKKTLLQFQLLGDPSLAA